MARTVSKAGKHRRRSLRLAATLAAALLMLLWLAPAAYAQTAFSNCITGPTDNSATVIIPAGVPSAHTDSGVDFTPADGDVFAVFAPELDGTQLCAGSVVWDAAGAVLTVWGDASLPAGVIDGMRPGEVMEWRAWDQSADLHFNVIVQYDSTSPFLPDGVYAVNGLYRLQVLQPTAVDLISLSASSDKGYAILFGMISIALMVVTAPGLQRRKR